mmetsp:Transcript_16330/g.24459  ORF Transcript_16330/g.24459 Transcript_16330/m.24459 type:complete len:222 (+) Transcript_16330:101-766(+)
MPPSACTSSMIFMADMWSMPGSRPISPSSTGKPPCSFARSPTAAISGLTYDAVTIGTQSSTHLSATIGWRGGGSKLTTTSASLNSASSAARQPSSEAPPPISPLLLPPSPRLVKRNAGKAKWVALAVPAGAVAARACAASRQSEAIVTRRSGVSSLQKGRLGRVRYSTRGPATSPDPNKRTCRRPCGVVSALAVNGAGSVDALTALGRALLGGSELAAAGA